MAEDLYNAKELWKRDDGNDGSTVRILQEICDRALALDPGPLLVVCHSLAWADRLASWLKHTADARCIYFDYKRASRHGFIHGTRFIMSAIDSYQTRGVIFTKIFIDNGVYHCRLTSRQQDELSLIKERTRTNQ
jgi:hypothetical protein